MVLGIVGPVLCVAWILAIVLGFVAKGQIDRSAGREGGRGMAMAGIILGCIWGALTLVYIVAVIATA